MPRKRDMPGNPEGDIVYHRVRAHYDAVYTRDAEAGKGYALPWYQHPGRIVWHPALLLARPPILDIGCGAGHLAAMCHTFDIAYCAGVDYSPAAIHLARIHAPGTRFITGDALLGQATGDLLQDADYTTACMLEILEHIDDDLKLIERVPRGRAVVGAVPDFPTGGHVRWFENSDQVIDRYSRVLSIDRIVTEHAYYASSNRWFIFRGLRK